MYMWLELKHMLGIYKIIAVLLGTLSSLHARTEKRFEEITLTGNTVNITSPGYPNPYDADVTYGWKIHASAPDRRVGIHIAYFSLEWTLNCQHDRLSFYDGPDKSNGTMHKLCGTTAPSSFLSSSNSMYIEFIFDSYGSGVGFRLIVIDVEHCGGTLTATSQPQHLTSPGYPYSYFNNLHCTWIITAENETDTVGLSIQHSDIEKKSSGSNLCIYDVLRVYNGNTTEADQYLGQSCANQVPRYQSSKNSLIVQFITDVGTTMQGFMLQYIARKAGDCNNTYLVYSLPLNILSPGYPDAYESNMECFITIADMSQSTQQNLKLDIVDSNIDGAYPHCENDSVTLYQGQRGSRIGEFCGDSSTTPVGPYFSNGIIMTMVFKTNGDTSGRGFRIRASHSERKVVPAQSEDCGFQFLNATTNRQFLQSPGYPVRYKNNEDCRWTITASTLNMMVRIVVIDSDIETHDKYYLTCRYDHVTAYDGPSTFNDTILSWCGPSRPTFQSTGSAVTIHFHTDVSTVKRGFKLAYFETNEQYHCGGSLKITTTEYTTLTSPNYPGPYPNVRTIFSRPLTTVLDASAHCNTSRSCVVNTVSNSSAMHNQECSWTIHAPVNMNIEAKIRNAQLESILQCIYDFLEIYDGVRTSSSSAGRFCGDDDIDYISSGQIITVRFHSDSGTRDRGFEMQLKAGHFRVSENEEQSASYSSKYIYSPNYPFNYPSNVEAGWKITADEYYIVKVNVIVSKLRVSFACVGDYVEAFDGPNSNAHSLGRWCGMSKPIKRSSGPVMFLKFKSDSSGVDRGFKMEYTKEYRYQSLDSDSDSDSDVGAIVGGSIGSVFLLLLILSVIGICIYKHGQRNTVPNIPVYYTAGPMPVVNNIGQAQITNAMPPTFTGPPAYTPAAQGAAIPSTGYVNAEALPTKY